MKKNHSINICRPGYGASCALCCGSHNYDAPPGEITALFRARLEFFLDGSKKQPLLPPKALPDALQCPHVAFTDEACSLIGCLYYHEKAMQEDTFFKKTCKTFLCPAAEELSPEEIIYAARLCGDWFYYSLLIHEIKFLRSLMNRYPDPDKMPQKTRQDMQARLTGALRQEER